MQTDRHYKNIVSSEKNPAKRMWSRLRQTYSRCGCGVEAGEGRGIIARKMNSLHDGSGNVLYRLSPASVVFLLVLLTDVIIWTAWNKVEIFYVRNINSLSYIIIYKNIYFTFWASRNIVVIRGPMSPLEPPGTITSFPRISWIKKDVNSLESWLPPSLCCNEFTCATSASTLSTSRVISWRNWN